MAVQKGKKDVLFFLKRIVSGKPFSLLFSLSFSKTLGFSHFHHGGENVKTCRGEIFFVCWGKGVGAVRCVCWGKGVCGVRCVCWGKGVGVVCGMGV